MKVSTARDRAPAAPQVRAAVAHRPPPRTEAKSDQGDPQVKREGDDKDGGFKPKIDVIADTLNSGFKDENKEKLPRDIEINGLEKENQSFNSGESI